MNRRPFSGKSAPVPTSGSPVARAGTALPAPPRPVPARDTIFVTPRRIVEQSIDIVFITPSNIPMKTPTLPARISSVFAFLWMLFMAALAVLTLYALFFTATSRAGTIVTGGVSGGNDRPFGFQKSLTAAYPGRYQQIYRAGFFPGVTWITQIAFREYQGLGDADATYTLSIGLGVTARTVAAPGTGFASGAATVFNGTASAHITASTQDFDLTFTLDTPFLYDPARGNLLLDIAMVSATKTPSGNTYGYFAYSSDTDNIARIVTTSRESRPSPITAW